LLIGGVIVHLDRSNKPEVDCAKSEQLKAENDC
jgi:hypothetical protein